MNVIYEKVLKCYENIRKITDFTPDVALILGTGLGKFAESIEIIETVEYKDIEGFPISTVQGHQGRFIFGKMGDIKLVVMQGRVHFYEGYSMTDVVLPVRVMKLLGAKTLFLTNAAGGINTDYAEGDFMLITDQICNVPSPLIGQNLDELGTRFPDMTNIYNDKLRKIARETAAQNKIKLHEGIYVQLTGPQFESPAEVRMWRSLGADAVGMSTACEAIAAVHCGFKVIGVSCITNEAKTENAVTVDHSLVEKVANDVSAEFELLVKKIIANIV